MGFLMREGTCGREGLRVGQGDVGWGAGSGVPGSI